MRVRKDNICKLFITIILLMVLTGCEKDDKGKSETETDWSMQNGFSYVCVGCERIPWDETKGNSRVLACSENEVFSCEHVFLYKGELVKEEEIENLVEEYDQFEIKTTILKYSIDDKKILEGIPFGEVDGYVIGASVCENEQLIMTLTSAAEYLGLEEKGWLVMLDSDGRLVFSSELDKGMCTEHLASNSKGDIFILSGNELRTYNRKGKNTKTQKLTAGMHGWDICGDDAGGCYILGMDMAPVLLRLCQDKEESFDKTHGFTEISRTPDGRIIARTGAKIYIYSESAKEWQELVDFIHIDICSDDIQKWWMGKNGNIYVILQEEGMPGEYLITAEIRSKEEIPEKETICIAVNGNQPKLRRIAVRFNRTNEKYRIEVNNYFEVLGAYSSDADYEAAMDRLRLDLISENKIDLIDISVLRSQDISPIGLLENLTPYLEHGNMIREDDFFGEVLQGATVEGSLLWLTDEMTVETLLCRSESLKQMPQNWTIEDMIKLAQSNREKQLLGGMTGVDLQRRINRANHFLECALALNQSKLFDDVFDKEAFVQIIQEAKKQYDSVPNAEESESTDDCLLVEARIGSFYDLSDYYWNYFHKQDITLIGYPTEDGKGKSVLSPFVGIGMVSSSKHKEAAWVFLEYYVQSPDSENLNYLSSLKSKFNIQMKKAYELSKRESKPDDANHIEEESLTMMEEIIKNAVGHNQRMDEEIMDIIYEEIPALYVGDKTVKEVADIIGNRVLLYLRENE